MQVLKSKGNQEYTKQILGLSSQRGRRQARSSEWENSVNREEAMRVRDDRGRRQLLGFPVPTLVMSIVEGPPETPPRGRDCGPGPQASDHDPSWPDSTQDFERVVCRAQMRTSRCFILTPQGQGFLDSSLMSEATGERAKLPLPRKAAGHSSSGRRTSLRPPIWKRSLSIHSSEAGSVSARYGGSAAVRWNHFRGQGLHEGPFRARQRVPPQPRDTWGKCLFGLPPGPEHADSGQLF